MLKWTPKQAKPPLWRPIHELENKTAIQSIHSSRHRELDGVFEWTKIVAGLTFVDMNFIKQRKADMERLWLCSHDIYYAITYGYDWRDSELAEALSAKTGRSRNCWTSYINARLFRRQGINFNPGDMRLELIFYGSQILYSLFDNEPVNNY